MTRPLIGITSYLDKTRPLAYCALKESYVEAVKTAGGIPVILPVVDPEMAGALLERIDGLLFSGGGDIAPWLFGQEPAPGIGAWDTRRDAFELALCREAWERHIPMLGICRGCQVMNVALGGSLIQDIGRTVADALLHDSAVPPEELAHEIELADGSRAERLFGTRRLRVNSFHHQAVDRPAPVLEITGRSADGVVEALEAKDGRFAVALQFHPEGLFLRYPEFLAPFAALVRACSRGE